MRALQHHQIDVVVPQLLDDDMLSTEQLTRCRAALYPDVPAEQTKATRYRLQATRLSLQRQTEAFQKELAFYDASPELLGLQRDASLRHWTKLNKQRQLWVAQPTSWIGLFRR